MWRLVFLLRCGRGGEGVSGCLFPKPDHLSQARVSPVGHPDVTASEERLGPGSLVLCPPAGLCGGQTAPREGRRRERPAGRLACPWHSCGSVTWREASTSPRHVVEPVFPLIPFTFVLRCEECPGDDSAPVTGTVICFLTSPCSQLLEQNLGFSGWGVGSGVEVGRMDQQTEAAQRRFLLFPLPAPQHRSTGAQVQAVWARPGPGQGQGTGPGRKWKGQSRRCFPFAGEANGEEA